MPVQLSSDVLESQECGDIVNDNENVVMTVTVHEGETGDLRAKSTVLVLVHLQLSVPLINIVCTLLQCSRQPRVVVA